MASSISTGGVQKALGLTGLPVGGSPLQVVSLAKPAAGPPAELTDADRKEQSEAMERVRAAQDASVVKVTLPLALQLIAGSA